MLFMELCCVVIHWMNLQDPSELKM